MVERANKVRKEAFTSISGFIPMLARGTNISIHVSVINLCALCYWFVSYRVFLYFLKPSKSRKNTKIHAVKNLAGIQ